MISFRCKCGHKKGSILDIDPPEECTVNSLPNWECKVCGYDYKSEAANETYKCVYRLSDRLLYSKYPKHETMQYEDWASIVLLEAY